MKPNLISIIQAALLSSDGPEFKLLQKKIVAARRRASARKKAQIVGELILAALGEQNEQLNAFLETAATDSRDRKALGLGRKEAQS